MNIFSSPYLSLMLRDLFSFKDTEGKRNPRGLENNLYIFFYHKFNYVYTIFKKNTKDNEFFGTFVH